MTATYLWTFLAGSCETNDTVFSNSGLGFRFAYVLKNPENCSPGGIFLTLASLAGREQDETVINAAVKHASPHFLVHMAPFSLGRVSRGRLGPFVL